eukprot:1142938-Pelagomonas_calceolata.AAC.2
MQMLDCCRPLEDVRKAGITLTHAACLSRCNGARVDLHRYGTFTLEDLRRQVCFLGRRMLCTAGGRQRVRALKGQRACKHADLRVLSRAEHCASGKEQESKMVVQPRAAECSPDKVLEVCSTGEDHLVVYKISPLMCQWCFRRYGGHPKKDIYARCTCACAGCEGLKILAQLQGNKALDYGRCCPTKA